MFRPLIGMDKDEITAEAIEDRQLSDFDHPGPGLLHAVHAAQSDDPGRLADIEAAEQALPIDDLVARAVHDAVVEYAEFPASARAAAR